MKNEIKTYRTASDKIQSRAFQAFGPWLCIAESKTRLRDQEDNWLDQWQVTEEWQYNAEGWSDEIYEDKSAPIQTKLERSERARKSLADAVDFLERKQVNLEKTLRLAARWGIRSDGYSAEVRDSIRNWVDAGAKGDAPEAPDYYPSDT